MNKIVFGKNRFMFKIIIVAIVSIVTVTTITLTIVLNEMNSRYINTLTRSALLIVEKTKREMRISGEAIIDIVSTLRSNWALKAYLSDTDKTTVNSSYTTYNTVNTIRELLNKNITGQLGIIIVGADGKTSVAYGTGLAISIEELLNSDVTRKASADPTGIHYHFLSNGFTWNTKDQHAFVTSAAVVPAGHEKPLAYIYIIVSQASLRECYQDMSGVGNFIMLLDDSGTIVSSTDDSHIGKNAALLASAAKESSERPFFSGSYYGYRLTGVSRPTDYWGLQIISVVDTGTSSEMDSAARSVLLTGIVVSIITILITIIILGRLTHPLQTLAKRMSRLKSGDLSERLPVTGEYEIRELTSAYNYMMDSINNYITQIKQIEQQKRISEIRALQTQIQPHFIYNTLASVKWLIWRAENEKASQALESFTLLIKNMISDETEMIPLQAEVDILKNYALLQQIRYGDHIRVIFNISEECLEGLIPKMVLQPIIENAFFHAFTDSKAGTISVFINKISETLVAEIIDDGSGFSSVTLERATCAEAVGKCGPIGVGLINVDERLKLMFGGESSITITSEEGVGTIIRMIIPFYARMDSKESERFL